MKPRDFLFYFLVILVFCVIIYFIWFTRTESFNCISNPSVYFIKSIEKPSNSTVSCSCISYTPDKPSVAFSINASGIYHGFFEDLITNK
jgi:hypothetical protein